MARLHRLRNQQLSHCISTPPVTFPGYRAQPRRPLIHTTFRHDQRRILQFSAKAPAFPASRRSKGHPIPLKYDHFKHAPIPFQQKATTAHTRNPQRLLPHTHSELPRTEVARSIEGGLRLKGCRSSRTTDFKEIHHYSFDASAKRRFHLFLLKQQIVLGNNGKIRV